MAQSHWSDTSSPALLGNERGFALPFAIFLVALMTVMLAASFARTSIEHEIASGSTASVSALSVAQAGLQGFFADSFDNRPAPTDSFRYNVQSGFAWVKPLLFRALVGADTMSGFTYVVQSTGYVIHPNQGSVPQARRTVAQLALWQPAGSRGVAAFTAVNGTDHPPGGTATVVDGNDACSGLVIAGYAGSYVGGPVGTGGTPTNLNPYPTLGIDWPTIEAGLPETDYSAVIPGDTTFATYLIPGDYTLTASGTGWLIVTGDLTTSGGTITWDGIVLVGGTFTPHASTTVINGQLITGLDGGVSQNDFTDGTYQLTAIYNSCNVGRALARYRGFLPLKNAWIDNWATY